MNPQDCSRVNTAFAVWQIGVLLPLWLETDVCAYQHLSCGWSYNHLLYIVTLCNKAELYINRYMWVPEIPKLNYNVDKLVRFRRLASCKWLTENEPWFEGGKNWVGAVTAGPDCCSKAFILGFPIVKCIFFSYTNKCISKT